MATTQITFAAMNDDVMPFFAGAVVESIAVSGTSARTTAASTASQNVARIATDTAVYVTFGADTPTATASNGVMCPANTVSFFRIGSGLKAAAITV